MSTYHILRRPLSRLPDGSVKWEALCGLQLALRPHPDVKPGGTAQTADKRGAEVIECAGCFAGTDDQPQQGRRQEQDPERPLAPGSELDDPNFTVLGEESDEFPLPPTA